MRVLIGRAALEEWAHALSENTGDIQVGQIWSSTLGWRVYMLIDDSAIALPPEVAEALAHAYIEHGGRDLRKISELIDALLSCAKIAARRNTRREIPEDALAMMTPMGSA